MQLANTIHLNLQLVNNNETQIRRDPFLSCEGDKIKETGFLPFSSAVTYILHHFQLGFYEQARCLFHKKIYLLWNGHLARS